MFQIFLYYQLSNAIAAFSFAVAKLVFVLNCRISLTFMHSSMVDFVFFSKCQTFCAQHIFRLQNVLENLPDNVTMIVVITVLFTVICCSTLYSKKYLNYSTG